MMQQTTMFLLMADILHVQSIGERTSQEISRRLQNDTPFPPIDNHSFYSSLYLRRPDKVHSIVYPAPK